MEALHIADPAPGTWTVHLSAPPGLPAQDVTAMAAFQGAVRAVLGVMPPSPQPGAAVEITMQVRGTHGPITDPAQLGGLAFVAGLSGDGFSALALVQLSDSDNHGDYQGEITVPRTAAGRLNFTGSVTGIGVSGDQRSFPTVVSSATAGVNAVLTLGGLDDDVIIGSTLDGKATVTNFTGQQRTLRLEVVDQSAGAVISADPATLQLPAAGNAVLNFKLRFDPATTLGANQARLRLVDESNNSVVGELLFSRNVVGQPSLLVTLLPLWTLLVIALIALSAFVTWKIRRKNEDRDIYRTRVELRRRERDLGRITAQNHGAEFTFGVRSGEDASIGLRIGNGARAYRVNRNRDQFTLRHPDGRLSETASGRAINLGDDLELFVYVPGSGNNTVEKPVRRSNSDDVYSTSIARRTGGDDGDPYLDN